MQSFHSVFSAKSLRLGLVLIVISTFGITARAQAPLLYSGSDTVEPIVTAAYSAYARRLVGYKMQMESSGTSVGLRNLCSGRTVMAGASRPIKPVEAKICATAGIQFIEIPVAFDALSLVVSTKNTWLKDLTLIEVRNIYEPAATGKLTSWTQVRPGFQDTVIRPAGADVKHGTFASFTESLGLNGFMRSDYKDFRQHEETGRFVAGDPAAIGFMPFADARAMSGQVRMIPIDTGSGPVMPGADEVLTGKYDKLARTIYIYVNPALLAKASPPDADFTKFLMTDMEKFVRFANFIPLRSLEYQENLKKLAIPR